MIVYYILTHNCNLFCSHCIRGEAKNFNMDIEKAILGLENIYSSDSDSILILSGGEPTLHPFFDNILSKAASLFQTVVINSNGTTDYFHKSDVWCKDNICVQFSLDGNEFYHDMIRGKGTFKKIVDNMKFINGTGKKIWISTVVSKMNYDSIILMPEILKHYTIAKWQVAPVMPFGKATDSFTIESEKWNNLVDNLISITPFRLGIRKLYDFNELRFLSKQEIIKLSENPRNKNFKNCGCVNSKVYVYPNMNVYPCTCQIDMPIGNIDETPFKEIIDNALTKPFICKNKVCRNCKFFPLCNGGCIGIQKKYGADIRCPIIREKIHV